MGSKDKKNKEIKNEEEKSQEEATEATPKESKKPDLKVVDQKLEDTLKELEEEKKKYLYLRADFENYKKQAIKERSDLVRFGGESVIREMLDVLDDLERATTSKLTPETMDKYKDGVDLIVGQFKKALEKVGVEEIPSKGVPFDPSVHEALSSIKSPDHPAGSIVEVFRKPYKLHGKLIRPGQVVVSMEAEGES